MKSRGDSLNPDDSHSKLNDKIDVTEWSERVNRRSAEVFLNVPSHQIIREGRGPFG